MAQLDKLPGFIAARRGNFARLHAGLRDLEDVLELPQPTPCSEPSWFGFPMLVRPGAPFTRQELIAHLESRKDCHQADLRGNATCPAGVRRVRLSGGGCLATTDRVMRDGFWLGVYPGLTPPMLDYMVDTIRSWCRR